MRWVAAATILPALLAGCGAKYKPKEAVHTEWERSVEYPPYVRSDSLQYLSGPATAAPVVPFMAFGAAFDLDLVTMHKGDDLDMLEVARLTTPQGVQWLALESEPVNGDQVLITRVPGDIDAWMPELPLRRVNDSTFRVEDSSGRDSLEVAVAYTRANGEAVEASYLGDPPTKTNRKRNGNTFNHSQNAVLAALDVSQSDSLFKANVKIDGKREGLKSVAAVVPGQFVLVQAQGGIAVGGYRVVENLGVDWDESAGEIMVIDPNAAPPPPPADPAALVQTTLATAVPSLKACHDARLEADEGKAGRIVLDFALENGALGEHGTRDLNAAAAALVDEELEACLTEALAALQWPVVTGTGSQELMFTTKTDEAEAGMQFGDFEFSGKMGTEPAPGPSMTKPEPMEAPDPEPMSKPEPAEAPEPKTMGKPADDEGDDEAEEGAEATDEEAADDKPKMSKPDPADDEGADEEGEAEGDQPEPSDEGGDDLDDLLGDDDPMMTAPAPAPVAPPLASFTTEHQMMSGNVVKMPWQVTMNGDTVIARQSSDVRDLVYTYDIYGEALELASITVEQYGRPTPVTAVHFSPPLPDLRRRFNGKHNHKYVIDINGQGSFATGTVEVFWEEAGPKVRIKPEAPEWTVDRSMISNIVYGADGTVSVSTQRVGTN